jgi:hypothetical protein
MNQPNQNMVALTIAREELFNGFLVPFEYDNNRIYSISTVFNGTEYEGSLYGFGKNKIFFIQYDNLPDYITVEIPVSIEGMQEFLGAIEYIIQRLSLNGNKLYIEELNTTIPVKELIKPYIEFVKNYEKNIQEIERLKND